MSISAVSAAATSSGTASKSSELTSETFLALLAAQLKSQDPLEPMSGDQMLNQISQLTSVGELMKLNENLSGLSQASGGIAQMASLLGRGVEWRDEASGSVLSGKVTRAQMGSDGWEVRVGDATVSVGDLLAVE